MGKPLGPYVTASGQPPAGDQANAVVSGVITAVGPTAPFVFWGPFEVNLWASVNTALTTTAGSLTATVASATGLTAGAAINSANVPQGTTAGALSGTTVTLALPPITVAGQINGSDKKIRNIDFTTGLLGATVTGTSIPASTTVSSVDVNAISPNVNNPGQTGQVTLNNQPTPAKPITELLSFARTGNAILVSGADANATFTGAGITVAGTVNLEKTYDGGSTWLVVSTYSSTTEALVINEPEKGVGYRLNCTTFSSNINYRLSATGGAALSVSTPSPI